MSVTLWLTSSILLPGGHKCHINTGLQKDTIKRDSDVRVKVRLTDLRLPVITDHIFIRK